MDVFVNLTVSGEQPTIALAVKLAFIGVDAEEFVGKKEIRKTKHRNVKACKDAGNQIVEWSPFILNLCNLIKFIYKILLPETNKFFNLIG